MKVKLYNYYIYSLYLYITLLYNIMTNFLCLFLYLQTTAHHNARYILFYSLVVLSMAHLIRAAPLLAQQQQEGKKKR